MKSTPKSKSVTIGTDRSDRWPINQNRSRPDASDQIDGGHLGAGGRHGGGALSLKSWPVSAPPPRCLSSVEVRSISFGSRSCLFFGALRLERCQLRLTSGTITPTAWARRSRSLISARSSEMVYFRCFKACWKTLCLATGAEGLVCLRKHLQ